MRILGYAGACLVVVALGALGATVLLEPSALIGIVVAGAVAVPIQVTAFALMARSPVGSNGFLAVWVGGTLLRMVVVGVVGLGLAALPELPPAPTLLGLVAFFFVMLLMEPLFLTGST